MLVFFPQDTDSSIWIPDRLIHHITVPQAPGSPKKKKGTPLQPPPWETAECPEPRAGPAWLTDGTQCTALIAGSSASVHLWNYGIEAWWGKEIYGNCILFAQIFVLLGCRWGQHWFRGRGEGRRSSRQERQDKHQDTGGTESCCSANSIHKMTIYFILACLSSHMFFFSPIIPEKLNVQTYLM